MSTASGLIQGIRAVTLDDRGSGYSPIDGAAIAFVDGQIRFVGPQERLPMELRDLPAFEGKGALATPGLIDAHTHLVFAGNRAGEYEQRLQGASYADIARAGGGILSTVRATREASPEALYLASLPRAAALVASGCTTLEIKSGYGLSLQDEAKMLRVARRIGTTLGVSVRTTYLGAHALPPEFAGQPDAYISAVCKWLESLHAEGLVDAVDAFCETIAFSPEQTQRVFDAATSLGLPVKLHADQLSDTGGAALVARNGGLSADHVEYTREDAVAQMAKTGTVAMLLPGSYHCLRETQQPPVAEFRKYGVAMGVSTDLNPGTSPLRSLPLAMSLACTHFRLTPEEALRGATQHAARALGLNDRGALAPGMRADIALWPIHEPAELCYWLGETTPTALWSEGKRLSRA